MLILRKKIDSDKLFWKHFFFSIFMENGCNTIQRLKSVAIVAESGGWTVGAAQVFAESN